MTRKGEEKKNMKTTNIREITKAQEILGLENMVNVEVSKMVE